MVLCRAVCRRTRSLGLGLSAFLSRGPLAYYLIGVPLRPVSLLGLFVFVSFVLDALYGCFSSWPGDSSVALKVIVSVGASMVWLGYCSGWPKKFELSLLLLALAYGLFVLDVFHFNYLLKLIMLLREA